MQNTSAMHSSNSNNSNCSVRLDLILADLEQFQMNNSSLSSSLSSSTSTSTSSAWDLHQSMRLRQEEERIVECVNDNNRKLAETWNSLGLVRLHVQKNVQAAVQCHETALKLLDGTPFQMEMAITRNDLGYCYERSDQPEDALQQYQLALRVLEEQHVSQHHARRLSIQRGIDRILRSWSMKHLYLYEFKQMTVKTLACSTNVLNT